jgi:hypothetical protein
MSQVQQQEQWQQEQMDQEQMEQGLTQRSPSMRLAGNAQRLLCSWRQQGCNTQR